MMEKRLFFPIVLALVWTCALAQSGRDTTPATDADITPHSSAPGSGAGGSQHGRGDSSADMNSSGKIILDKKFEALDSNRDGFISRAEAKKSDSLDHSFNQADTNKDGKLSRKEYQAFSDRGVGSSGAGGGVNKNLRQDREKKSSP